MVSGVFSSLSNNLTQLKRGQVARVVAVRDQYEDDKIARRIRELGFAPGERVQLRAKGPFGKEPLLIQVGMTRFALRQAEAARVDVELESA